MRIIQRPPLGPSAGGAEALRSFYGEDIRSRCGRRHALRADTEIDLPQVATTRSGILMPINQGGRMSQEALLGLWRQYHDNGNISARDRLVFSLAPIVKCIVYRKIREIPAYREVDDFISCGLEALIRSLDRYDPDKGATLEQFAWTRIHGAVLDELHRHDWAPRSLRRDERAINTARERFLSVHERHPSREELAAQVGM